MKKKKNICLVHGWGANIYKLDPLKKELVSLGWNVLLPKLPFFDLEEPKAPWNLIDFAHYIESKASEYFKNNNYCLFGHSLGGRIAIKAAVQPQSQLNSIVLCAAAGISRTNPLKRWSFFLITKSLLPFKVLMPSFYPLVRKIIYRLAGSADYLQIDSEAKRATFRNVVAEDLRPLVPQINLSTLIVWGQQDVSTPLKDAYFLQKTLPNAKLKIFPTENHRLPYNQPKEVAKLINDWFENK